MPKKKPSKRRNVYPVFFALWPDDRAATGPFYSNSGHLDVFATEAAAEAFRRKQSVHFAKVVPVRIARVVVAGAK